MSSVMQFEPMLERIQTKVVSLNLKVGLDTVSHSSIIDKSECTFSSEPKKVYCGWTLGMRSIIYDDQ